MKSKMECQAKLGTLSEFEKEQLLEVILNDSPDVTVFLATDFTIRMVNRAFTQQTGLAAEQAVGNSDLSLFPALRKRLVYLLLKSRLAKQAVVSKANLQLPGSRNETALWQATVHPIYKADSFQGWVLHFKKIGQSLPTGLLRTPSCGSRHDSPDQAGLAKILQAINGLLPLGIAECDLDGALLDVSEAFLVNTGLTWEEGQGYGWTDLIPIEERTRLIEQWRECCRRELNWSLQYQIRCRNGIKRVILSRAQPNRDFQGKLISWLIFNFDITNEQCEREENWQAFQAGQEFFNLVINHAAIGVALYSGDGLKLRWGNPIFQEFMAEAQAARMAAGVQSQHHLPYVDNFQLDQLAATVLASRTPLTDLTVRFEHAQQPERAHWRLGIVPVWTTPAKVPDLLITAINVPATVVAVAEQQSEPEKLSSADWETVVDRLAEGLMVLNQSGRVMALNQKAVELLGVSPDTNYAPGPLGDFEPLSQLYALDGSRIAADDWPHCKVLRGETLEHFEVELRRADQTEARRLCFNGNSFPSGENQERLVVVTCSDRTETQRLQKANRQLQMQDMKNQKLIERFTETAPLLDTGLCKIYNAPNMDEILKTTLEAVRKVFHADDGAIYLLGSDEQGDSQEIYQLWHDEAATVSLDLNEQPHTRMALETGKAIYFTAEEATAKETDWFSNDGIVGCLAIPLLDGAEYCIGMLFLHFRAALSFNDADQDYFQTVVAKYAVVIAQAKKHLERSQLLVRERRARVRAERKAGKLSALLQSLQEGVNVIDTLGNILLRNNMERQITRVPDQAAVSILDYGDYRLLWPDNTPVPVQQLPGNRLLRGEVITDTEFVMEHSDGTRLNIMCCGGVVRDEDGQIILGILITRDITAMRQLEENREAFIRTFSHDLRNPLTVVSARSQLLQRRLLKQNLAVEAEETQVIYVSARRMSQMIQELFDSYRLEANDLKLNKNMIDLAAVIKDLITRIGLEEDLRRLQLEITPGDYRIYADEGRLERVVTNLITNALKYSPSDQPVIVRLISRANQITIEVTDFGMGIEPQDLPKVFDRYYRAQNAKKAGGLGLGLYIVKLIVEAHDGKIKVLSQPEEGSTFSITLPVLTEVNEKLEAGNEQ